MNTTLDRPATAPRILGDARGAVLILEAAIDGGIPLPDQVQIMELHSTSTVVFYVRNLDELTTWAMWIDEPIDDAAIGERVHHSVDGVLFDQPLRVLTITKPAAS